MPALERQPGEYFQRIQFPQQTYRVNRNGGHISPNIYNDYSQLKETHGVLTALQIIRFRLAHIPALISVAEKENLLAESQARVVEEFDAFIHETLFDKAKRELDTFVKEVREEGERFKVLEKREDIDVSARCYSRLHTIEVSGHIGTSIIFGCRRVYWEARGCHSSVSVCNWHTLEFTLALLQV